MTRGNQREKDREKAQKKLAAQNKPKESGASLQARREADAAILRAKQQASDAAKAAAAAGGGGAPAKKK